jgi:hypothetical protein
MNFDARAACLLAFELTGGMSVVHTTGMFGWAGTPYVFQCITRVLSELGRDVIQGDCLWYVDDAMGISAKCDTSVDLKSVKSMACGLLGSSAIADDKTLFGEQQDWIGWLVDVAAMTVSITARNMLKTIHAFFGALDVSAPVSLQVVERMASLSSRYAMLYSHMAPFTSALHSAKKAYNGCHATLLCLPVHARADVELWRAFLCLLHFDYRMYT